ncbi:MAG: hypothetical protein EOO20_06105 [Chryseobacterium sp.]|nr:MAG: hypothetical protein EOO20_06105 [Chryseobacterium sp.]
MRKLILALGIILLSGSQVAVAQSKPAETKASMLKTLRSQIVKELISDGTTKEKSEQFGDCFIKDLGEKLSPEELKLFYKLSTTKPGQAPPKELIQKAEKMGLKEKMQEVGKDCGSIFE